MLGRIPPQYQQKKNRAEKMLLPGIALSFGNPRSRIRVQLPSGLEVDAIAATEINKSDVTVGWVEDENVYLVWGDATPREVINPQVSLSRIRPRTVVESTINYPIKILFTVDNDDTNKTEFWLGGDRKNPVKIHELPINDDIEVTDAVLSNLGKKNNDWIAFVKWFDQSLPVEFENTTAFNGSTIISFLKYNDSVEYGVTEGIGDRPYQINLDYRGSGVASINPRFLASIDNLPPTNLEFISLDTTTRILHDPFTRNLNFIPITISQGYSYEGWTELNLYVLSGLENDPVNLFDMIPRLQDNLLSPDYNFSLTHTEIRQYFQPFSNNRNFQEAITQRGLADFNLTKYKGFLADNDVRYDPYAFFLSAETYNYLTGGFFLYGAYNNSSYVSLTYPNDRGSLFKIIDRGYNLTRSTNTYPRQLIQTEVYTLSNKPPDTIYFDIITGTLNGYDGNHYLELGLRYEAIQRHRFYLRINHKYDDSFDRDNYYDLNTVSYDTATMPLAEVDFNEYNLNNLSFTGSLSLLRASHFVYYSVGNVTPKNPFFRFLTLKKISGSANITSIGQQAEINYLEKNDQGATPPLTDNKWAQYTDLQTRYKANIPYIYFKGKSSYIAATLKVDLKISTSTPQTSYQETYKLYWGEKTIEISDFGDLAGNITIGEGFMPVLNIQPSYDTLIDNYIYRVIEDDNLIKAKTGKANLFVIKYKINEDGTITKSTKRYPVLSLKNADCNIWSASFYPQ